MKTSLVFLQREEDGEEFQLSVLCVFGSDGVRNAMAERPGPSGVISGSSNYSTQGQSEE